MKSLTLFRAVLASAMLLGLGSGLADTTAFLENAAPASNPGGFGLAGFEFTLTQNIEVTQLGFYALSIGGGDAPHVSVFEVVGGAVDGATPLYDTGNILTSITVNDGAWTYVSVSGLTLSAGHTYVVTAPSYFTAAYTDTSTFTYGAELTDTKFVTQMPNGWGGWSNAGYNFANLYESTTAYTPANFQYVALPEPSTYAMMMAGLLLLLGSKRGLRRIA